MHEIPSEGKLKKLYIPALIAYAVRSARRVLPLYNEAQCLKDHHKHFRLLEISVDLLIRKSTTVGLTDIEHEYVNYAAKHASAYIRNCESAETFDGNYENVANYKIAEYASSAAYWASCTADISEKGKSVPFYHDEWPELSIDEYNYECALRSHEVFALFAYRAAEYALKADANSAIGARIDFEKLLSMNLLNHDTIDLAEDGPLGPFWPEGQEPDWFRDYYSYE